MSVVSLQCNMWISSIYFTGKPVILAWIHLIKALEYRRQATHYAIVALQLGFRVTIQEWDCAINCFKAQIRLMRAKTKKNVRNGKVLRNVVAPIYQIDGYSILTAQIEEK